MNNFRELLVWDKAVELAIYIYELTEKYPRKEVYGLTSQIRRSVVSISSNIAEGSGRRSKKEFRHFLDIAFGSCFELETQLIISFKLNYIDEGHFADVKHSLIEVQKMLYALNKTVL